MKLRQCKTIVERRKLIEEKTKLHFESINIYPKGLEQAQLRNCENMIGAVQIPLGIAGPLLVKGEEAKGEYFLPLATSEGALVASVNRGCKAISLAGGVTVFSENAGMTRGPIFKTKNLKESFQLKKWLEGHFDLLAQTASSTSSHIKLMDIFTKIVGRNVYIRFSYDTDEAMGMNMVTIATDKIVKLIEEKTETVCLSLAGNFDTDKKPSWLNFILGRGREVWVEALISEKIVKEVLKTTPQKIHQVVLDKCHLGSMISGSMGYNAHFANIITSLFIALGQDVAHTVEGSLGVTATEITNGNLYLTVYLPDLPIGTVGGGTVLPSQKEALKILGIEKENGKKNSQALAEIIGGAVLAGELSLLAALAQGELAGAHLSLARGKNA